MARSIFASFLLFVALLVGLTSSNAQLIGVGVTVNITGVAVCPTLGDPIAGVNVTFSCDGGQTIIAQTITSSDGSFQLTINPSNINLSNITGCGVIIPLPVNTSCIPALPTLGSLEAPVSLTGITSTVVGLALNLVLNILAFPFAVVQG